MGGMASPRGPVPAGRSFSAEPEQAWGEKDAPDQPQVYRVVRELLGNGSGRLSCCGGWKRRRGEDAKRSCLPPHPSLNRRCNTSDLTLILGHLWF